MQNEEKTDKIQNSTQPTRALDVIDRKILSELTKDADTSYADLSTKVGLSAPAVHERVKRLRSSGRIKQTAALLDGSAVGKPLLAFVHLDTEGWGKTEELMALGNLPELEEMHSITGDSCMLLKVRLENSQALEGFLAKLYQLPGVRSTKSYVVLSTYLERPVQADISKELVTT
ncbi:Lrp/AsnC family transcriptional regulator [Kiloniella majae]|uniref:Lrp/AsnC family transcriptional regulator n=1 Tax=Kiloniella majae TaxID=1938558 RepID=UPI000A279726|nr:Lrp/AsnC family transcriptional regulator [Kiloniella majae]